MHRRPNATVFMKVSTKPQILFGLRAFLPFALQCVDPRPARSTCKWRRHMQALAQDNPFAGANTTGHTVSGRVAWTGRIISGLAVAFLIFDSLGKLLEVQPVIDGTKQLGFPTDIV